MTAPGHTRNDPLHALLTRRDAICARIGTDVLPPLRRLDFERFDLAVGDHEHLGRLHETSTTVPCAAPLLYVPSVLDWGGTGEATIGDDGLGWWDAPGTHDLPVHTMHGGQRIELTAPIYEQDVLTRRRQFVAVKDKHGRSGRFVRMTKRSTFERGADVVLSLTEDIHVRAADRTDDAARATDTRSSNGGSDAASPGAASLDAAIPVSTFAPSRLQGVRFSQVTSNTHLIHLDAAYAAEEGFEGPVVQSSVHGCQLLTTLTNWLGSSATVEHFEWRNLVPASFGTTFHCSGEIERSDADRDEIGLTERSADGVTHAIGRAVVTRAGRERRT